MISGAAQPQLARLAGGEVETIVLGHETGDLDADRLREAAASYGQQEVIAGYVGNHGAFQPDIAGTQARHSGRKPERV